jgi:hypothetical protein
MIRRVALTLALAFALIGSQSPGQKGGGRSDVIIRLAASSA